MAEVNESPATPLAPSSFALMAMIEDGVDTGYRMKQRLERFAWFFWSATYGQIYPQLRRLEAAGMIVGRETKFAGRLRREYALTETGRGELRRYLDEPSEPTVWIQDEAILRLGIIDWSDRELLRKHLVQLRALTTERLSTLRALTPPRARGQRLQALGVRTLEETLAWCEETEAELLDSDGAG